MSVRVAVIGAGPYGLATAAHLRGQGIEHRVFGEPLSFWQQHMPKGMRLRSAWEASHIDDPGGRLSLDRFVEAEGPIPKPVPLTDFIRYGAWFERNAVPDVDRRFVERVERNGSGFRLQLADGDEVATERVVVAGGIAPFARRPELFDGLPADRVSHSSDLTDPARFTGAKVLVVGSGQSALECAALLNEASADVELVARAPIVHFLRGAPLRRRLGPLRPLFYPSTDVGPPGLNLIAGSPTLFRLVPSRIAGPLAYRCIRPAGSGWLVERLEGVPLQLGRSVVSAAADGDRVRVELDDGSGRTVDHIVLATGYRVDIDKYPFLSRELLRDVARIDGYPRLGPGFESSARGLHFVGATAAVSFGPVMRFVSGTRYAGPWLARHVRRAR
jgi:FAD-dependent urate hydroxylase